MALSVLCFWFLVAFSCYFLCYHSLLETEEEKKDLPSATQVSTDTNNTENKPSPSDSVNIVNVKETNEVSQMKDNSDTATNSQSVTDKVIEVTNDKIQTESDNVPNVSGNETVSVEAKSVEPPVEVTKEISEKAVIKKDILDGASVKPIESTLEVKQTKSKPKDIEVNKTKSVSGKGDTVRPPSPLSPVFDSNDFSYEEDAMPGKSRFKYNSTCQV